jgi:hypothetical protein
MPDRRTFLIACGGAMAVPAVAPFALARAEHVAPPALASVPLATPALRVDGWDSPSSTQGDVWVHINSSWRATWR